jgi:hypothetical protein
LHGTNLTEVIALRCIACHKFVAMRVDPEDVQRRHADGVYVQHAFADHTGKSYLTPGEAEMWISGLCNECWTALCPNPALNPTAYN